jgi:hypothetical protein
MGSRHISENRPQEHVLNPIQAEAEACTIPVYEIPKGLFTRNTIFVSHHVVQQRPTKLGSILTVSDDVVQHGAIQKSCFM